MQEVTAIVVCGQCSRIFNSGNMLHPCPNCGGEIVKGMVAGEILDAIDDSQAMLMAKYIDDDWLFLMNEHLEEHGYQFCPEKSHPDRLTKAKI